jgi:hypothetical protein
MIQDVGKIKEKIISFIRLKGPSLPVHVAKETELSILFASAFLSELFYEKKIKISNLKVGNSPLYFIPGQEPQLENFSQYLKDKEKESFLLLKEKKILKDSELQPAIRVALGGIKDFAIAFQKEGEKYWRYFLAEESVPTEETETKKKEDKETETNKPEKKIAEKVPKKEKIKRDTKKKQNKKKEENFFNKIKEFLEKRKIEIIDIKNFKNNEAILKIKKNGNEELLFAFNKKKITEKEILNAHKKASEENMAYNIFSMGEPSKKIKDWISAIKSLSEIDKIE